MIFLGKHLYSKNTTKHEEAALSIPNFLCKNSVFCAWRAHEGEDATRFLQNRGHGEVVELSDDDDELVVAPPKRKEPASQQSSDEDDFDAVFPARSISSDSVATSRDAYPRRRWLGGQRGGSGRGKPLPEVPDSYSEDIRIRI